MRRPMLAQLKASLVVALVVGLSFTVFHFQSVAAPGFGSTCMNRHDATFQSVLIHAPAINYTGSGDEIVAAWPWGYDITIIFKINPAILMNPQPNGDLTNGSIFFANDIMGTSWDVQCIYNIGPDLLATYLQFHPANLTGFEDSHQLVTLSTGMHSGQYNVNWIGP